MAQIPRGVFGTHDFVRFGLDHKHVSRLLERGALVRLRRGAYVSRELWDASHRDERRRYLVDAELAVRPHAVASHVSALVLHDVPLVRLPTERLDLACDVSRAHQADGVHLHRRDGLPLSDGLPAVSLPLALVQTASLGFHETAVAAADAALHRGDVTLEALEEAAGIWRRSPKRVREFLAAVDARSESPGESLLRLLLRAAGFAVASQVAIRTGGGSFRVDFLVDGVVVEFDGQVKYADDASGVTLLREKRREDAIRRAGYPVVRVVWSDLDHPSRIIARIRAHMNSTPTGSLQGNTVETARSR